MSTGTVNVDDPTVIFARPPFNEPSDCVSFHRPSASASDLVVARVMRSYLAVSQNRAASKDHHSDLLPSAAD